MPGAKRARIHQAQDGEARIGSLSLRFVFKPQPGAEHGAQDLAYVRPAPTELAVVLLGVDEVYRVMAVALRYPPHGAMLTSARNPELKVGLQGAAEVINAVRDLLVALPSLIASLFQPRESWRLAKMQNEVAAEELRAKAAAARADAVEADVRLLDAQLKVDKLQRRLAALPIRAHGPSQRLLRRIAEETARADPTKARGMLGASAAYLAQAQSYTAPSRIMVVPDLPGRSRRR